jgi:hypothetical protein
MLYTLAHVKDGLAENQETISPPRQNSGRYYCRLFADGKQRWFSLKTTVFTVAEVKLAGYWLHRSDDKQSKSRVITSDVGAPVCGRCAGQVWRVLGRHPNCAISIDRSG